MKKVVYISLFLNFICLLGIGWLISSKTSGETAFFMSSEVYNNFAYKVELEQELESSYGQRNADLDSMEADINLTIKYYQNAEIPPTDEELIALERKQQYYFDFRDQLETDYAEEAQESYALIWNRINMYVAEYGQDHGYEYIFGANGDGSLMYADESADITEEVIEFVNQKYAGG